MYTYYRQCPKNDNIRQDFNAHARVSTNMYILRARFTSRTIHNVYNNTQYTLYSAEVILLKQYIITEHVNYVTCVL